MENEYYKISNFDKKIIKKEPKIYKKTMCKNIVNHGNCNQGQNCHFAHSLNEQYIITERKAIYDIINGTYDLSNIDLNKDKQLYENLKILTVLCNKCVEKHCSGGYNCRDGSYSKKYQICLRDINYGFCNDQNCDLIHLSKRGMKPFYKKDEISSAQTIVVEQDKKKEDDNILIGKLISSNDFSDSDDSIDSFMLSESDYNSDSENSLYSKSIFE